MWEYAQFTKDAKKAGGPEKFKEMLRQEGIQLCERNVKKRAGPVLAGTLVLGTILGIGIPKFVGMLYNKKHIKKLTNTKDENNNTVENNENNTQDGGNDKANLSTCEINEVNSTNNETC